MSTVCEPPCSEENKHDICRRIKRYKFIKDRKYKGEDKLIRLGDIFNYEKRAREHPPLREAEEEVD